MVWRIDDDTTYVNSRLGDWWNRDAIQAILLLSLFKRIMPSADNMTVFFSAKIEKFHTDFCGQKVKINQLIN